MATNQAHWKLNVYVIAKSQMNLLLIGKSHGDAAICSLLRQGIRIQLLNDEIATAHSISF